MKTVVIEGKSGSVLFETNESIQIPVEARVEIEHDFHAPEGGELINARDDLRRKFEEIEGVIEQCALSLHRAIAKIPTPEEVEVEFGITLGGSAGIPFVSQGTVSSNFKVCLKWKPTSKSA